MATYDISNRQSILEIGAGKIDASQLKPQDFHIYVDRSYEYGMITTIPTTESHHYDYLTTGSARLESVFVSADIFEFTENYKFKFDKIIANRIFEHVEYCDGSIGRLLEACYKSANENAKLEIIVPNAHLLSQKLIQLEKNYRTSALKNNLNDILLINSEFCNIKADCHASVWSPTLAEHYISQEMTWKIENVLPQITFAGRDIYMKIICHKNSISRGHEHEQEETSRNNTT